MFVLILVAIFSQNFNIQIRKPITFSTFDLNAAGLTSTPSLQRDVFKCIFILTLTQIGTGAKHGHWHLFTQVKRQRLRLAVNCQVPKFLSRAATCILRRSYSSSGTFKNQTNERCRTMLREVQEQTFPAAASQQCKQCLHGKVDAHFSSQLFRLNMWTTSPLPLLCVESFS